MDGGRVVLNESRGHIETTLYASSVPPGFKIRLQNNHRCEFILMACAFSAGNTELDAGGAGSLGAEGFIPHFNGNGRLISEFVGKAGGAAACGVGIAVFVKGLADDDQTDFILHGNLRNLRRIDQTRNMLNDFQRAGNGGGGIAEREADPLFAVVNSKDSHNK